MSYLRQGKAGENRRSVFYTTNNNSSSEEWEMVDAPPKDCPEQKHHPDAHRRKFTLRCLTRPTSGQNLMLNIDLHSTWGSRAGFSFLLPQIPLAQRSLLILCATPRALRGLCFGIWWERGGLDATPRPAVVRVQRWNVTAAKLWTRSFALGASGKNWARCSRNKSNSEKSWPVRRYSYLSRFLFHAKKCSGTQRGAHENTVFLEGVFCRNDRNLTRCSKTLDTSNSTLPCAVGLSGRVISNVLTDTRRPPMICHAWPRNKETAVVLTTITAVVLIPITLSSLFCPFLDKLIGHSGQWCFLKETTLRFFSLTHSQMV